MHSVKAADLADSCSGMNHWRGVRRPVKSHCLKLNCGSAQAWKGVQEQDHMNAAARAARLLSHVRGGDCLATRERRAGPN